MHIESVHLHGFGRLAGREFRFGPGLTVVHGPNEAGKSTLHAALSAALFGLVGGGRRHRATRADRDPPLRRALHVGGGRGRFVRHRGAGLGRGGS